MEMIHEEDSFDIGAAVAAARATLEVTSPARGQPALIVLSGLPGTGKSTLARGLAGALPAVVIESDRLRQKLFSPPAYSAEESRRVHQVCHILIGWYLRHYYHVVYDATNLYVRHRQSVYRVAERNGARLVVVKVTASPEVVRERLMPRRSENPGAGPLDQYSEADWDVYQRMRRQAEPIQREHITVDTSDGDLQPGVGRVLKAVGGQPYNRPTS
jgi:predicted kinase